MIVPLRTGGQTFRPDPVVLLSFQKARQQTFKPLEHASLPEQARQKLENGGNKLTGLDVSLLRSDRAYWPARPNDLFRRDLPKGKRAWAVRVSSS